MSEKLNEVVDKVFDEVFSNQEFVTYPEINPTIDELKSDVREVIGETIPEEPKELTEEEKREILIQKLKESKLKYKPKKDFGNTYKAERKRKNKQAKKSRKANRK